MPASTFVFRRVSAAMRSALPTAKAIRQPATFRALESEIISIPASTAPGAARKLGAGGPSSQSSA